MIYGEVVSSTRVITLISKNIFSVRCLTHVTEQMSNSGAQTAGNRHQKFRLQPPMMLFSACHLDARRTVQDVNVMVGVSRMLEKSRSRSLGWTSWKRTLRPFTYT